MLIAFTRGTTVAVADEPPAGRTQKEVAAVAAIPAIKTTTHTLYMRLELGRDRQKKQVPYVHAEN